VTTVLFVHGLESGPLGHKPRALAAAGFNVVAEQMPCGRRHVTRDPVVLVSALGALGLSVALTARWRLVGLATAAATGAAILQPAKEALTRRTFERSIDVQLRTLRAHAIDVVVGSSFGGAVVLELLRRGAWSGPTVLLCPAHLRVAERAGRAWTPLPPLTPSARALIVHAREDAVVPQAHSQQLAAELGVELITVEDDHRLSRTATSEGLASWVRRVL
jgi:pimeloyl-ACP methyl ester carboxylesterase